MRKTPWFLLLFVMAFALVAAACSSDDDDGAETTESTTTTTEAETTTTEAETTTTGDEETTTSDAETTSTTASGDGTIFEVLVARGENPTLVAALEATGLDAVLSGAGPFTLFAPTEDAFAAALDSLGLTADELLADDGLEAILTYHVLPVEAPASTVATLDGEEVETVNGATVLITIDGDSVMVNEATVIEVDIEASNGVIHDIDAVLIPPAS